MVHKILFLFIAIAIYLPAKTQQLKRVLDAVRTSQTIKIDGELNDEAWKNASLATDFIEQRPQYGAKPYESIKTEMWFLYNDNAIYVSGFCHEPTKDSISKELIGRDNVGVNDFAGVVFDTYQDEINGVGFYVTVLGEQFDLKYSIGDEDDSWSTVYKTATQIKENGWTFEMEIPYSALRFSKEQVQSWGVNFVRRRSKTGQQYLWNPVNPNKFGFLNQAGTLKGFENIKAPLRLSFSPYFSSYLNGIPNGNNKKTWNTSINGGMDVKYGISKAFTLDMTLIPDFGQVQSDNQVLNLTPFEVRYNENRSFFTEGTELFNKGNFFYSRRIGGVPLHYSLPYSYNGVNKIITNPSETKLINATKISGRTAKGLGIGFFNAITKPQFALVETINKEEVQLETNPLTNYNILVLDQTMKNNSSVTLVNTNVLRNGSDYDANVTAGLWDLYDNKVDWNFWGKIANSRLIGYTAPGKTLSGYMYEVNVGKFKGPFNFEIHQYLADDKYQQNDMGYFTNNNYRNTGLNAWYKVNKPKGIYNNMFFSLNTNYSQLYKPLSYQYVDVRANFNMQLKSLWNTFFNIQYRPEQQDFYEPRKAGRVFKNPSFLNTGLGFGTNRAKRYSASLEFAERLSPKYNSTATEISVSNQFRFNDKLSIGLSSYNEIARNNVGFAYINKASDSIFFGLRNRYTSENILNVKYNFNIKMGLTFRARHYWSKVNYKQFYNLQSDGYLKDATVGSTDPNNNANFFNIDMVYTWQFAPGSFVNIGWKNSAEQFDKNVTARYYTNLHRTITNPQLNNFSVKVIYFLDYLALKSKKTTL